ncbi:MAG: hypothetical protein LBR22_04580 [Desulfovibrio sp.]|jgi:hypothetical protein|nr:hypothetical protein [Desulfovibrio sp.]
MTLGICLFAFAALLGLSVIVFSHLRDRDCEREREFVEHRWDVIRKVIHDALKHKENLVLTLHAGREVRNGLPGVMRRQDRYGIEIDVLSRIDAQMTGTGIDVHFSLKGPHGPLFYKFDSRILSVCPLPSSNRFRIAIVPPHDLKVAQRRGFTRVSPPKEMVRAIALWPMDDATPTPKTMADLGRPALHYWRGMNEMPVKVENISASGIAVRIATQGDPPPLDPVEGSEMLALIVYGLGRKCEQVVRFWCTCLVTNVRPVPSLNQCIVLGMQFRKWAVTEPDSRRLNWIRTSPMIGVGPITQWVKRINRHQHRSDRDVVWPSFNYYTNAECRF